MKRALLEAWGYIGEILLAFILVAFALLTLGAQDSAHIAKKVSQDFGTSFSGIMLAGALTILGFFLSSATGEFYKWLRYKTAYFAYLRAFLYPSLIYGIATLLSLTAKISTSNLVLATCAFVYTLSIINTYTMTVNFYEFLKLKSYFEKKIGR